MSDFDELFQQFLFNGVSVFGSRRNIIPTLYLRGNETSVSTVPVTIGNVRMLGWLHRFYGGPAFF